MLAVVLAAAIGIGCGGTQRDPEHEWSRSGPPSCVKITSTRVQVRDAQYQPLASVVVHIEIGGQTRIMTSDPKGAFELAGEIPDDATITAPGYEIVSRSSTASCHAGLLIALVLRPVPRE